MKCPKCGYVSHDYLDACRKCSIDLIDFKTQMQLHTLKAAELNLLTVIGGATESFNPSGVFSSNDSLFESSMLDEVDMGGDFDITLDDDVSFAPSSSGLDDPGDTSGIFSSSLPGFEEDGQTPAPSGSSGNADEGTLGPPTSGYATVLLDVGHLSDDNMTHDHTHPTATPPIDEALGEPTLMIDEPEPDMISLNTSELVLPADSTEMTLFDSADLSAFAPPLSDAPPSDTDESVLTPPPAEDITLGDTQAELLMDDFTHDTAESFIPPLEADEAALPPVASYDATLIDDPTLASFDASLADLPTLDTDDLTLHAPPTEDLTLVDETTNILDEPLFPDLPAQPTDETPTPTASYDATLIDDPTLSDELDLTFPEPQGTISLDQALPLDVIDDIEGDSDVWLLEEDDLESDDNIHPTS